MNIENGNRMWVNLQILVLFIYIFEIQQMFWKKKPERSVCYLVKFLTFSGDWFH